MTTTHPQTIRPQTIQQFVSMMEHFRSPEARAAVNQLQPRATDVFISTFAKSGTTWMQQIVHQIKCRTDDTFSDIYNVVPWIESAIDMNIDPAGPQRGEFRAFKSHLSYGSLPKGSRYIIVVRDPITVIPSWFRFFEGWLFEAGSLTLDDFAREFYLPRFDDHADHFIEAFKRRNKADTLVLCYEDLIAHADQVPALVADFLAVELDETTLQHVTHNCSRDYMYRHKSKFEEQYFRQFIDAKLGLPAGGESSKVNQSPPVMSLSNAVKNEVNSLWKGLITTKLGFEDYQHLKNALPNPLNAVRDPSHEEFLKCA